MERIVDQCSVCDRSSKVKLHCHYGADKACQGCRAFFHRIHKTSCSGIDLSTVIGPCKNPSRRSSSSGQLCSMYPGVHVAKCRYCRYKRCLQAGMNPCLVLAGDHMSRSISQKSKSVSAAAVVPSVKITAENSGLKSVVASNSQVQSSCCEGETSPEKSCEVWGLQPQPSTTASDWQVIVTQAFARATAVMEICPKLANELFLLHSPTPFCHQLDPVNWQKKNHAFEMQFAYFGEVNPLLQMLEKDEKRWILRKNGKMFVGHMWLKYFSGQLGNDQVATFIGYLWGGKMIKRDLLRKVSMKEFFSTTDESSIDLPHFLTRQTDMMSLLHDRKLSQTFQSLLCTIYIFCHDTSNENLKKLYRKAEKLFLDSPEAKVLSSEFNIPNWIKDVHSMMGVLKLTSFYKPEGRESIQMRDTSLPFTSEEALYFSNLMKVYKKTAEQVSFGESVLDEVLSLSIGAPINILNLIQPSYQVFMARTKTWLEAFPIYNLLSVSQKRQVMNTHIRRSLPLRSCQLEACMSFWDQMHVALNSHEMDFFKNLGSNVTDGASAAPIISFRHPKSYNIGDLFPEDKHKVYLTSVTAIEATKTLLKIDYGLLEICLVLRSLEEATKNEEHASVVKRYINNLKQLVLRKIGSLQEDADVENSHNQVMARVESYLQPLEDLYIAMTHLEKSSLLQNDLDTEIGLPYL